VEAEKAAKENVAANNSDGGGGDEDVAPAGQKIKITVQAQGRADVIFEVNSDKKILKMMTAYAKAMVRMISNTYINCATYLELICPAELQTGWAEVLQHGQREAPQV
jgi:hypothetical protein